MNDQLGPLQEIWPLVGRKAELDRIAQLFRRGFQGVVLVGPAGAGKTRLAVESLRKLGGLGAGTLRVTATRGLRDVPLGLLAPLVPSIDDGPTNGEDRAGLVLRCREALMAHGREDRLVLLVDDAHLVDEMSAAIIQQLVRDDRVFLVATLDEEAAGTDLAVSFWKDDNVDRVDVRELGVEDIDALLGYVLGGPVEWATSRQFAKGSGGNLVFLRELLREARDQRDLRLDEVGVWRLTGPLVASRRLVELVQARMAKLDAEQRSVVELIAFGEPLAVADLHDMEGKVVADLERDGMVVTEQDSRGVIVRLSQAVFGSVIRATIPVLRTHEVLKVLAERVEDSARPEDQLRVAAWRLEAGGADAHAMLSAARLATSRYDFELADRLVRRSLSLGPSFDASLLAAQIDARLGRGDHAERSFAELWDRAPDDARRAQVAISRMDNLVFSMGHVERGLELAEDAERHVGDVDWRNEIAAKRASVVNGTTGPAAAAAIAVPILSTSRGRAVVWASTISSYALGREGHLDQAIAAARRGAAAQRSLPDAFDWPVSRHAFFLAEALAHRGRLDDAFAMMLDQYRQAVDAGSQEEQAWFSWQLSMHATDRGHARSAAVHGRLAVALFRDLGRPQFEYFARGHVAAALAIGGARREAAAALAAMDQLGLADTHYWSVDVAQSRAWSAIADGRPEQALVLLGQAGELAREIGDRVGESSTRHLVARLGRPADAVERLHELGDLVEGDLAKARAEHAQALLAGDPDRLEAVAESFWSMGAHLLSAEALAGAAELWRSTGKQRAAAAAHRRLLVARRVAEDPSTPALAHGTGAARLTPAELRTAMLAVEGRTNSEIAQELVVSVRTVQNQLQHAYEKLGIRSRGDLADALAEYEP